jgi:L-threonate 2-dehydrogenase
MGSAIGERLTRRGATVVTSLAGRSAASGERARRSGFQTAESDDELVRDAAFVLSILPPGEAVALAERLRPALERAANKPIYADCNAIAPVTVAAVHAVIAPTGCRFVDAGIVGGPPRGDDPGPRLYASGPAAGAFAELAAFGLTIRPLAMPIGAASALKMSYGGITKGLQAVGTATMLAAQNAELGDVLRAELRASQPVLFNWLEKSIPTMFPKAYRWVAEMDEIGTYLADDAHGAGIYHGAARLYEFIAQEFAADRAVDPTVGKPARAKS